MDEILKRMKEIVALAKAETRDFNEAETKEYEELRAKADAIEAAEKREADIAAREVAKRDAAGIAAAEERSKKIQDATTRTGLNVAEFRSPKSESRIEVPFASTRSFTETVNGKAPHERAYDFGIRMFAGLGNEYAIRRCQERGIEYRGQIEGVNSLGGFLVPSQTDPDMIKLVLSYGVFGRYARRVAMASDSIHRNALGTEVDLYPVGEAQAGTGSQSTFDQTTLTAKDWMGLAAISKQVNDDSIISMADELAEQFARAKARRQDQAGFIGDGTSTYHGIRGVRTKLTSDGTAGIVTAASGTHTNWAGITLANFSGVIGKLPDFEGGLQPVWFTSKPFWSTVMEPLALAAGGNTVQNILNGTPMKMFLGYPVETTEVMPKTAASAEVVCLFGDLRRAADLGIRNADTFEASMDATIAGVSMFETNQIGIRYTTRFGINVHNVGDSTNAGPVVGLKTAS